MSSIEDYLSSHAFFSGLDDSFIEFLSDSATKIRLKAGDALFKQGERADKFYLLRSGQVVVQVPALMGPTLDIQTLGEDQILGWSWLIAPYRWSFQARAVVDSELIEFDGIGYGYTKYGFGCRVGSRRVHCAASLVQFQS